MLAHGASRGKTFGNRAKKPRWGDRCLEKVEHYRCDNLTVPCFAPSGAPNDNSSMRRDRSVDQLWTGYAIQHRGGQQEICQSEASPPSDWY